MVNHWMDNGMKPSGFPQMLSDISPFAPSKPSGSKSMRFPGFFFKRKDKFQSKKRTRFLEDQKVKQNKMEKKTPILQYS
jgi:hypothetical protein